jgi:hypothetical protein
MGAVWRNGRTVKGGGQADAGGAKAEVKVKIEARSGGRAVDRARWREKR